MAKQQKNKRTIDKSENQGRKQACPIETVQDTASTPELYMESDDNK